MSGRVEELTSALIAMAEVQRNDQTFVNKELHKIIKELMNELKLK